MVITVEVNMTETVKKNHRKYRWCFWHLWPLLNLPQGVNFISLFATRWRSHLFFLNLEFWAEIFCGRSIDAKNHFYRCEKLLFVQKWAKTAKRLQSKYCTLLTKNLKLDKLNEHWGIQTLCKQLIVDSIDFEGHFQSFSRHQYNFWIWVFGPSKHFLGKKWLPTPVEMIFCINGSSTKNFSSKFQLWEKMIAAPPGSRTHIIKTILAAKLGIFKGIKNM